MKFPTFLTVFLFTAILIAVPFVSTAVERERDERTRPDSGQEQPPREEPPAPERDEENEPPQGAVVYNKNGVVVHVDESGDTTTVTVTIDGKMASKITHTGSGNDDNNNGGGDSAPGEDGEDGSDGDDNNNPPAEDDEPVDDDRDREDREPRTR